MRAMLSLAVSSRRRRRMSGSRTEFSKKYAYNSSESVKVLLDMAGFMP